MANKRERALSGPKTPWGTIRRSSFDPPLDKGIKTYYYY